MEIVSSSASSDDYDDELSNKSLLKNVCSVRQVIGDLRMRKSGCTFCEHFCSSIAISITLPKLRCLYVRRL